VSAQANNGQNGLLKNNERRYKNMKQFEVVKYKNRYCLYMLRSQCHQTIKGYRKHDYIKLCERLNKIDEVR
jgi:hypothetical protein